MQDACQNNWDKEKEHERAINIRKRYVLYKKIYTGVPKYTRKIDLENRRRSLAGKVKHTRSLKTSEFRMCKGIFSLKIVLLKCRMTLTDSSIIIS